ncbi:MAG: radical SAM protein [Candidatus Margulisiibacteriota bacterium]
MNSASSFARRRKEIHALAKNHMASCDMCPRVCRINRLAEETGECGCAGGIPVSHYGLHYGEEPPISGTRGSGTIFFSYCNLHCVFCQNYQISQQPNTDNMLHTPESLADIMLELQNKNAHNINLVSPSHVCLPIAESICIARERGLDIPIVYNSNGYDSVAMLKIMNGLIDIYMPDIKYADNENAAAYSSADNYVQANRAAVAEMFRQVGLLTCSKDSVARRGLLVRHLVLPHDLSGSIDCLRFLAALSPKITISLMSQYSPQYKAPGMPLLNRPLLPEEYEPVIEAAESLCLENVFIQELESQEHYLPNFNLETPFTE